MQFTANLSKKNLATLQDIQDLNNELTFLKIENSLLKKLRFFGGAIQGQSQLSLNNNNYKINSKIKLILEYKKLFANQYELDYQKSMNVEVQKPTVTKLTKKLIKILDI